MRIQQPLENRYEVKNDYWLEYSEDEKTSATHLIDCIRYLKSTVPDFAKWTIGQQRNEYDDDESWINICFTLDGITVHYSIDWNLDEKYGYLRLSTEELRSFLIWKEYNIKELPNWKDLEQDLRQCLIDSKNAPNMEKEKRRKLYLALKEEFECDELPGDTK